MAKTKNNARWEDIVAAVAGSQRVLLVWHIRPDGDSVASAMAVARALRKMGKQALVVCPDTVPENLLFIAPPSEWARPEEVVGNFDHAVFLDCAGLDRIGPAQSLVENVGRIVNIDHHESNQRFGDLNYVDPGAAACVELAHRLIRDLGLEIDPQMATALYTGLTTDTGSFRFENTRAETLRFAADLVAGGANPALIGRQIWDNRTPGTLRLLHAALGTVGIDPSGRLAWIEVTAAMIAESAALPEDAEGLVEYPRSLRGVDIAVLFAVQEPGAVRCSLRGTSKVDVSLLAAQFGGGGHPRAAGCTIHDDWPRARELVLDSARKALEALPAEGDAAR